MPLYCEIVVPKYGTSANFLRLGHCTCYGREGRQAWVVTGDQERMAWHCIASLQALVEGKNLLSVSSRKELP